MKSSLLDLRLVEKLVALFIAHLGQDTTKLR